MKGSDNVLMTVNIGGELIDLNVKFDDQNGVRDAEREVKLYRDRIRKQSQEYSDRKLLAMAAFQFAKWYHQLLAIQDEAMEIASLKCKEIDQREQEENEAFSDPEYS